MGWRRRGGGNISKYREWVEEGGCGKKEKQKEMDIIPSSALIFRFGGNMYFLSKIFGENRGGRKRVTTSGEPDNGLTGSHWPGQRKIGKPQHPVAAHNSPRLCSGNLSCGGGKKETVRNLNTKVEKGGRKKGEYNIYNNIKKTQPRQGGDGINVET